jgi:hypothetical protein
VKIELMAVGWNLVADWWRGCGVDCRYGGEGSCFGDCGNGCCFVGLVEVLIW